MADLTTLRQKIRQRYKQTEPEIVAELLALDTLSERERSMLVETAAETVEQLRQHTTPTLMESFLSEYGLSTREGVGLMCLAEALLRVPDAATVDELIADKIEPSNWGVHLGKSSSSLVNASTWALMLTGRILDDPAGSSENPPPVLALRQLIKRLGEPLVRTSVSQAMKLLGKQFVLGQSIGEALDEARELEAKGYTYSYDMLGEAARTHADAQRYFEAYARAIKEISGAGSGSISERPGISIKLSALHPRYEYTHKDAVMKELVPRIASLVDMAAEANIGLNIDAEEADRLDLSLDIIEALLSARSDDKWNGFGVVVQAYGRRALPVLHWLVACCQTYNRKIMVRLVKGAYWDAEIKQAQELGLANFPVYTRKATTDLSYLACAQMLLEHREIIYPQFATHNAHTVCAIRYMAGADIGSYEFQRLHGMGESLHEYVHDRHGTRCRIYAPVGAHVDLLAYLVRRLLENGANSSFVNQIVNEELSPHEVARCPVQQVIEQQAVEHPGISKPLDLFLPQRLNSKGYRVNDPASIQALLDKRDSFSSASYEAKPLLAESLPVNGPSRAVDNPATPAHPAGQVVEATVEQVDAAINTASQSFAPWQSSTAFDRSECLARAAMLYEQNIAELSALLCREAGKSLADAISEVREAVDFLRYYAAQALDQEDSRKGRGVIVCISPWNFPLAIFTGQIAAALAAGNTVVAKPAQQTPLIANLAVGYLHESAIPASVLQLLPGDGSVIGNAMVSDARVCGVCFTGSGKVARHIAKQLAGRSAGDLAAGACAAPVLIAETGGLNAMIADTTALTEQVVRDVLVSAFQSAGQRCSALRMLYVQEEAEDRLIEMLSGAIETLVVGDPWQLSTDVGPVIDAAAHQKIDNYVREMESNGKLVKQLSVPDEHCFIGPAIIRVSGIEELSEEIFGPVLHVASYKSDQIDAVIDAINGKGYGLTFGLHTRIDDRVQRIVDRVQAGNIYVNRNQIGAIVGSQPFGGEGESGTGPKAGGPAYLQRFYAPDYPAISDSANNSTAQKVASDVVLELPQIQQALDHAAPRDLPLTPDDTQQLGALLKFGSDSDTTITSIEIDWLLPGPTGESNRLTLYPRGVVLVTGTSLSGCMQLCVDALISGCAVVVVCPSPGAALTDAAASELGLSCLQGSLNPDDLTRLTGLDAVAVAASADYTMACNKALSQRSGAIIPLVSDCCEPARFALERHVCIDTTAAGGNATLLAASE